MNLDSDFYIILGSFLSWFVLRNIFKEKIEKYKKILLISILVIFVLLMMVAKNSFINTLFIDVMGGFFLAEMISQKIENTSNFVKNKIKRGNNVKN